MGTELPMETKDEQETNQPDAETFHLSWVSVSSFERITKIEAPLGAGLTTVTSQKNGAGKTSFLDAICAVFGGKEWLPKKPLHGDAKEARIECRVGPDEDPGRYTVTRIFRKDGKDFIELMRTEDDGKLDAPTRVLADWRSDLAFDPLAFVAMAPGEQRDDLLAALGLGDAVAEIEEERKTKAEERKAANATVKRLKGAVSEYADLTEAPEVPSIEAVIEQRKGMEAQRDARNETAETVAVAERGLASAKARAGALLSEATAEATRSVDTAEAALVNAQASADMLKSDVDEALVDARAAFHAAEAAVTSAAEEGAGLVGRATKQIAGAQTAQETSIATAQENGAKLVADAAQALDDAEAIAEGTDACPTDEEFAELDAQLSEASTKAAELARWDHALRARQELKDAETAKSASEQAVNNVDARKVALIQGADLPVPELGLGEGGVTFDGVPFAQADDAQKLRASFMVAMARNPKVRLALVRKGNDLDPDNLALLGELAEEFDAQVIVERLDPNDAGSVVIEDGRLAEKPTE